MTTSTANEAAVAEVLALEERRFAAMVAKDTAALGELFADELSYTHSNASVDTKATFLAAIEARRFDYRSVTCSDRTSVVLGDTALLTGRAQIEVLAGGREVQLNARFTVTYVRKDGRWQFLAWQSTSIPA
jgi:ketosteroid isomerase-like protein